MSIYKLARRLSHADVDFLGELKVPALLGLLEQAAVEASSAVGFDAARYTREGRIWIIRRTRLHRLVPVGGGDTVDVETRVADFRRARSLRRYAVQRHGQSVAEATTDWVYCDLQSGRPVRIPEPLQRAFRGDDPGATPLAALPRAAAVPSHAPGTPVEFTLTVQPSHLDHVAHVNNAVYAAYLEDGAFALFAACGWPLSRMLENGGALRIRWLDAEYLDDAAAGATLHVYSWLLEGSAIECGQGRPPERAYVLQTIRRSGGEEIMRAHSEWVWRRRPEVVGGVPGM